MLAETTDAVTSVRIVSVDHYLTPPNPKFDAAYSEFRGAAVRRVPVIRVFGSTADGAKVCAHIHGVFPYLYIPVESGESDASLGQFAYQITNALDRGLSVTQGRVSSTTQHIFKAVPVRGRPFYGYHARDHLFLKVYFYNPAMVKRAANLLQNGAICGRVFQAHESHVPYILQFFIDYNLYGMSFLNVNTNSVRYRSEDGDLPRMATTRLEMDVLASGILNRTSLRGSGSEHQNPGIAAIWEDELRRRRTMGEEDLPPIEVPDSQERPKVRPTDTDRSYREILTRKLMSKNVEKSAQESSVQSGKKFSLSALLNNSVYPGSCPRTLRLPEASMVPDHIFGKESTFKCSEEDEKSFLDTSLVDESIVLSLEGGSLSQNHITLDEEDMKLLAIMQQLEENEEREIDLDSTLAPLSQPSQKSISSQLKKIVESQDNQLNCDPHREDGDLIEDEDLINEFNETMEFVDREVDEIPQLDGEHEVQKQSPTRLLKKGNSFSKESPKKNSKSPKKNHYAPLNLIITSPAGATKRKRSTESVSPVKFKSILKTPSNSTPNGHTGEPPKKKLKFNNVVLVNGCFTQALDFTPKRQHKDLEVSKSFKSKLESSTRKFNYDSLKEQFGIAECAVCLTRIDISEYIEKETKKKDSPRTTKRSQKRTVSNEEYKFIIINSPHVYVERLEQHDLDKVLGAVEEKDVEKDDKVRPANDKAHKYDMEHNFFPIAGPSNVNYYDATDIPTQYYGAKDGEDGEYGMCDSGEYGMNSFYDMTMCLDNTDDELSAFAREQEAILTDVMASESMTDEPDKDIKIYPYSSPPKPDTVRETMHEYGIEEHVYTQPFFSDPIDVAQSSRKEVGPMVLQVKGNALSICEEFISCLEDLQGLSKWRQKKFQSEMGDFVDNSERLNIRECMATESTATIEPQNSPPSVSEARTWLKVRDKVTAKITMESVEVDSPVKLKREKQRMNVESNSQQDIEECSSKARCSLTFKSDPFGNDSQIVDASPSSFDKTENAKSSLKSRLSYATRRLARKSHPRTRIRNGHGSPDEMSSSSSEKLVKSSGSRHRNNNVKRRTL